MACTVGSVAAGSLIGLGWLDQRAGFLGIIGISILLLVQTTIQRPMLAIAYGWLSGLIAYSISCAWLAFTIGYLGEFDSFSSICVAALMFFLQGSQYAIFSFAWWIARRVSPIGWLTAPAIWVAVEQYFPSLFPAPMACLFTGMLPMLQLAEVGGVHLVSMMTFCLAGFFAWTFLLVKYFSAEGTIGRFSAIAWIVCAIAISGVYGWGEFRIHHFESLATEASDSNLRVGMIQADTQYYQTHQRMIETARLMNGQVDLILWPEASLGQYSSELTDFSDPEVVYANSTGDDSREQPFPNPISHLIAGGDVWIPDSSVRQAGTTFVSALLFDTNEQLIGRHDKNRLMPFGEFIPAEALFPWMRSIFGGERVITRSTDNYPIGTIKGIPLGVFLCCEDMHPDLVRDQVNNGSRLLITIGNGMAFDSKAALEQHFRISQFRAIEHRLPFIRCTSKGVSAQIGPSGRVLAELPAMQDAAGIVNVRIESDEQTKTLFTKTGNLIPNTLTILLLLSVFFRSACSRRSG